MDLNTFVSAAFLLTLVMDPLGNIPMFISALKEVPAERKRAVLARELVIALGIMLKMMKTNKVLVMAGLLAVMPAVAQPDKAGKSKPFVRDVTTGYLLDCSFLSPRPYCWPKRETVMLSGWDVDKSGGDFDYKPTGEVHKDFQFHSEWFKLVDTNTSASVTLKHQIARQTEGQVTLEFRFRMPVVMEGASWQLRDLEQAGPSLLVQGGNLCWGNGKIVVPLEVNRDYGVKVVADITANEADVYVLMQERYSNRDVLQKMKFVGVDYCYAYTWSTPNAGARRNKNIAQRKTTGAEGIGVLPSISMGWAREPWGVRDGGYLPPADYKTLAQWAVSEDSNWTGRSEFSSDAPFYAYILLFPDVEGPDSMKAAKKGEKVWFDQVQGPWDEDRKQFIFPYTNYWQKRNGKRFRKILASLYMLGDGN